MIRRNYWNGKRLYLPVNGLALNASRQHCAGNVARAKLSKARVKVPDDSARITNDRR